MKKYSESDNYILYQGNMLDMLQEIKENSIDSIVTDPPYELNFMNKGWDNSGIAFQKETWQKCYDVLKPGGYLLAFGGSRTYHRIACAIEDAGFEIRDCIMWLYGSGFPKSMNIGLAIDKKNGIEVKNNYTGANFKNNVYGKVMGGGITIETQKAQNKWNGWGTCLKPAYEPIIVARKPFKGSLVDNVIENSVGGLNIDECRVPFNGDKWKTQKSVKTSRAFQSEETTTANGLCEANSNGRFPANVILTYDENDFDEVCGNMPYTKGGNRKNTIATRKSDKTSFGYEINTRNEFNDSGSASRYFYCAKASKKDRDEGLDVFKENTIDDGRNKSIDNPFQRGETLRKNTHPTVKPTELMQYLIRLVTPKNGIVLDPFMGSGSTGKAVMYENKERNANYKFIGIELTEEYLPIAEARINYAKEKSEEENKEKQINIFDFIEE